jgi:hypothetical protein
MLIATLAWILIGLLAFVWIDTDEMKKDVPYGELPSILPLKVWRTTSLVVLLIIAPPLVVTTLGQRCVLEIWRWYWQFRLWRAKRRLKKKFGVTLRWHWRKE